MFRLQNEIFSEIPMAVWWAQWKIRTQNKELSREKGCECQFSVWSKAEHRWRAYGSYSHLPDPSKKWAQNVSLRWENARGSLKMLLNSTMSSDCKLHCLPKSRGKYSYFANKLYYQHRENFKDWNVSVFLQVTTKTIKIIQFSNLCGFSLKQLPNFQKSLLTFRQSQIATMCWKSFLHVVCWLAKSGFSLTVNI